MVSYVGIPKEGLSLSHAHSLLGMRGGKKGGKKTGEMRTHVKSLVVAGKHELLTDVEKRLYAGFGRGWNAERKDKISHALKGRRKSAEHRVKMSEAARRRWARTSPMSDITNQPKSTMK